MTFRITKIHERYLFAQTFVVKLENIILKTGGSLQFYDQTNFKEKVL